MPLYSDNQREIELQKDFRGQSELPTWLESLRVNEPDDLPDWMQSLPQTSQPFVPQNNVYGNEQSSASQVRENFYTLDAAYNNSNLLPQSFQNEPSGLNASSLLVVNSLPRWHREE